MAPPRVEGNPSGAPIRRHSHGELFAGLLIAASVFAAYCGTFHVPFLFDDYFSIVNNASIRRLSAIGDVLSPPAAALTEGRPLANLTFAVSYATSGLDPWAYHLLNLGVHTLAALVLFGVVRRTLLRPLLMAKFGDDAHFLAAAIAVLWAIHPLQTQTVTYVSQRTESLMALFYLLTLYCFIRGIDERPGLWHPLAVGACLLGVLSKEVIATAPLAVLLYDRTFVAGTFRSALRARWRFYGCLASTWLVLAWLLIDVKSRAVGYGLGIDSFQYALTECKAVVVYLSLSIWPHPLIFDRGIIFMSSMASAWPYVLAVACLLLLSAWALARRPALGFLCAWFFVVLAPTSSVVPVIEAPIAENRPYLPSAALIAMVVLFFYLRAGLRPTRWVCALLAATCLFATARRNRDYASETSIWTDTIAKVKDNFRAYDALALSLAGQPGRQAEVVSAYEAALRLRPDAAVTHNNLGTLLAGEPGREAEAIAQYEAALRLDPDFAEANSNLGYMLVSQPGRQAEAIAHCETALRLKPDLAEAHDNLGLLLSRQPGRQDDALVQFETALRLKPDLAEAHDNMGLLLSRLPGRQKDALTQFETALRLKPDDAKLQCDLADFLVGQPGSAHEAIVHYEAALRINPNCSEARDALKRLRQADSASVGRN